MTSAPSPHPIQQAIVDGIGDTKADVDGIMPKINSGQISSSDLFGSRDGLKNNYFYRYMGAKLGLYGNTAAEAVYYGYFADASNQPLDASKNNYELHFAPGAIPEYHAFWSLTMYDGKTQFLVANALKRYLLNSTTLKSYKYGPDGGLTFYIQKDSPGKAKESNWLPAPDGPFYAVYRVYMPGKAVLNGAWKKPPMQPVPLNSQTDKAGKQSPPYQFKSSEHQQPKIPLINASKSALITSA